EIKNENILYEKILNANLFAGLFEQDFESNFEHPTFGVDCSTLMNGISFWNSKDCPFLISLDLKKQFVGWKYFLIRFDRRK
ncbi:MAG: hypothetical protein M0P12_11270, partial [Paludibacteraceae bacterium]|nr:hypothetical protein [Paludibacteraceae bacterium]